MLFKIASHTLEMFSISNLFFVVIVWFSGDQVLEWNGTSLTGKTYEEVQRIIATSGDEVEIVIRR